MKRRNALKTLVAAATPATAAQAGFAEMWRRSFAAHWRDTREYTLAVLEAMPEDGFTSKPDPAQRTFGEQLVHLAFANVVYFRAFGLVPLPETSLPADRKAMASYVTESDKESVRRFVTAAFDYVAAVLEKIGVREMEGSRELWARSGAHSGIDVCLRAYMHTAHHRGQIITYLRVKGITPPAWKFEPKA